MGIAARTEHITAVPMLLVAGADVGVSSEIILLATVCSSCWPAYATSAAAAQRQRQGNLYDEIHCLPYYEVTLARTNEVLQMNDFGHRDF
jgi:hypothetical protein